MRNFLNVFFIVAIILFSSAQALCAGGPIDGNSLGGNFSIGNDGPFYSSHLSNNGDILNGSFSLRLDPNEVSFDRANWNFSVSNWDESYWTATCYLYGKLDSSEEYSQNQHWSQEVDENDFHLTASLSLYSNEYDVDQPQNSQFYINGRLEIGPVESTSSNFRYWEDEEDVYSWSDGYGEKPIIVRIPVWRAEYRMNGRFLTDTPQPIPVLGAVSIPEPSSIVMISAFCFALVGNCLRRRKR